jgi:hypothetical protein
MNISIHEQLMNKKYHMMILFTAESGMTFVIYLGS